MVFTSSSLTRSSFECERHFQTIRPLWPNALRTPRQSANSTNHGTTANRRCGPETAGARKSETREVIAKAGNSREKAQKAQEKALFPYFLRLLRLFAASFAIGSRSPKPEANPNLWEGANGKTESRSQRSLTAEITKIAEEDKAESLQQIRLFAACE